MNFISTSIVANAGQVEQSIGHSHATIRVDYAADQLDQVVTLGPLEGWIGAVLLDPGVLECQFFTGFDRSNRNDGRVREIDMTNGGSSGPILRFPISK